MERRMKLKEKIASLKSKGVTFNVMDEIEAKQQLKDGINYFELLDYLQNYERNCNNCCLGADIAYLISINRIDLSLRKVIIDLCLDLEHELKRELSDYFYQYPEAFEKCIKLAGKDVEHQIRRAIHSINGDKNRRAVNVISNMHFYPLIHMYRYYGQEINRESSENEYYCLINCKDLRNLCAHNQPLFTNLRPSTTPFAQSYEVMKEVATMVPSKTIRNKRMANETINDLACLFYLYPRFIKDRPFLFEARHKMFEIREMMIQHLQKYQDTELVISSLQFMIKLIDNFIELGTI